MINPFSVLISLLGETERGREGEGEGVEEGVGAGGEKRVKKEKGATYESVTVLHSPINHLVYTTHYLPGGPLF